MPWGFDDSWLRDLPDLIVVLLAAACAILLVLLTGVVAHRRRTDAPRSAAALEAYKITVTYTAILLAFTLVQATASLRSAEALVSKEAGAMNQLDRVLLRYGAPATDTARGLLHDYMHAVVDEEWDSMRRGLPSATAAARMASLNRAVQGVEGTGPTKPQSLGDMLKLLDVLNDLRQERMDASTTGVPVVLWHAVGALALILITTAALIQVPGRLVAIGGHAVAIAILWSLAYVVDEPYQGQTAVSSLPIQRVLDATQTRQR